MSELYTITKQYHEKKGTYIYVLRLVNKVDKDEFDNLRNIAKEYDGYYSTYRGVNGFVFQNETCAEVFGYVLDAMYSNEPVHTDCIDDTNESKGVKSNSMTLHQALRNIILTEGQNIIKDVRLVNMLDDLHAYNEFTGSKYILRSIITEGYSVKLHSIGAWNNDALQLASKFAATTGFIPDKVNIVFKSIAFGIGWISKWDEIENPARPGSSPSISNNTPNSAKRPLLKKWSKKMDEEETEQFFLSIVEYDKADESKYKVALENLQFFVDEDEDLHISCEIRRRYRKEYSVNLLYALYDLKGRLRYARTDVCVGYTSPNDSAVKPISVYFDEMKADEIGKIRLYWQSPDFQYY